MPSFAAHAIWVLSRDQASWTSLPGAVMSGVTPLPSAAATTMSALPPVARLNPMNPAGPGGAVIDGEGDCVGATDAGALTGGDTATDGGAVGDAWAIDGLGVELAPPPRTPERNRIARTATTPTAPIKIAGPAFPERAPPLVPVFAGMGWGVAGDSSAAQFWQKTRSDGFRVPQLGQMMPVGGGGGGGGGGAGIG